MSAPVKLHQVLFVRLRFLLVFVAVGVVVGSWDRIMNAVDRLTRPAQAGDGVTGEFEWFCPMHPSVVRNDPNAKCPICGMPLSRRKRGEKAELSPGVLAQLQLSPHRILQAGVATEPVGFRRLVREIRTVGQMEWDERKISHPSARVAGRVDELFVNFTGQKVRKGDPIYKLYSPDLVTTQEEYLLALRTLAEIRAQGDAAAVERAERLASAARERLRLWGIADDQIAELEKSKKAQTHLVIQSPVGGVVTKKDIDIGHYVAVGEDPFTFADDSALWMQAEVFERDLALVKEGLTVEIVAEAWPGRTFAGKVAFVGAEVSPATRTVRVRAEVPNADGALKAGMYVTVLLRIPLGRSGEVFWGCCENCPDVREDVPGKCRKCEMELVKKGGATAIYRCPHDGGERSTPGPCPKCGMPLDERHRVKPPAAPLGPELTLPAPKERSVYVCDLHPEEVSDKPGQCFKGSCAGMKLEERRIAPEGRLVYVCPDHPDVVSDKPGLCPKDGKKLGFRIVSDSKRLADEWACPMHPERKGDGKAPCPDCGAKLKHLEHEELLAVPVSAVIDTGHRKVVFVERGTGIYHAIEVVLGPRAGEYFQGLKGLAAGERVVTAGAFLLDAEARLNPAAASVYFGASGGDKK